MTRSNVVLNFQSKASYDDLNDDSDDHLNKIDVVLQFVLAVIHHKNVSIDELVLHQIPYGHHLYLILVIFHSVVRSDANFYEQESILDQIQLINIELFLMLLLIKKYRQHQFQFCFLLIFT